MFPLYRYVVDLQSVRIFIVVATTELYEINAIIITVIIISIITKPSHIVLHHTQKKDQYGIWELRPINSGISENLILTPEMAVP